MKNSLSKNYDYVISLGSNCQVAYQLSRLGLRGSSLPFDWAICDDAKVIKRIIQTRFLFYFRFHNLISRDNITVDRISKRKEINDKKYNISHIHKLNEDQDLKTEYKNLYQIEKKRIKRFNKILSNKDNSILFVRYNMDLINAQALIKYLLKRNKNSSLLIINPSDKKELKTTYEQNHLLMVDMYINKQDKDESWQGNDDYYDELFEHITCFKAQKDLLAKIDNDASMEDNLSLLYGKRMDNNILKVLADKFVGKEPIYYLDGFNEEETNESGALRWTNKKRSILLLNKKIKKGTLTFSFYDHFASIDSVSPYLDVYINGELKQEIRENGTYSFDIDSSHYYYIELVNRGVRKVDNDERKLGAIISNVSYKEK